MTLSTLLSILISIILLGATVYMLAVIPKGFMPSVDTGQIFAQTEAAQGISYDDMVRHQQAVADIVRQDPNVDSYMSSVGARGGITGPNTGVLFMSLKPRSERLSAEDLMQELRVKFAKVPGIRVYMQIPPLIRIGGQLTRALYQLTLLSPDTDKLYDGAPKFQEEIHKIPGVQDLSSDLQIANPQVTVNIDRDKAAAVGVTAQQIEDTLYYAYGSRQISTIYAPNNQYQVILEVLPEYQLDPSALSLLYVRSSRGQLVPLSAVANLTRDLGPLTINHTGQIPSVTISFNLAPGQSLGNVLAAIDRLATTRLDPTITRQFQGTAQAFQASVKGLGLLLIMAILVIYLVLGILYESFIHPLTILSALPLAGFGAVLTLMAFHVELSIYAFVGVILLVGLVKKNGIMMIDFAIEAQKTGLRPIEAIHRACMIRFRPIMMTTMAAFVGTLLIAIGIGAGAEARRPLGLAVVGGLVFSQSLTLYVTPVFYLYMDRLQRFLGRWFSLGGTEEPLASGSAASK